MNDGAAILAKHKWLLAVFAILALVAVALCVWIEVSGRPPANLPISLGLGDRRSAPFTIYQRGLYVVSLQLEEAYDRAELECAVASLPLDDYEEAARAASQWPFPEDQVALKPRRCAAQPANLSWSIYRRGVLVARDAAGPNGAISRITRMNRKEATLELGSVQLAPGGDYLLEVSSKTDARALGLRHPTVRLALHVWDVKNGMGLVLMFLLVAFSAVITLLILVTSTLVDLRRIGRGERTG